MWSRQDARFQPFSGPLKPSSKGEPLIEPSLGVGNGGFDNENGDLICYRNFDICDDQGRVFRIIRWVGSGQFGQVYECQYVNPAPYDMAEGKSFAVKISKSTEDALCQFNYEMQALQYVCNSFIFFYFFFCSDLYSS